MWIYTAHRVLQTFMATTNDLKQQSADYKPKQNKTKQKQKASSVFF